MTTTSPNQIPIHDPIGRPVPRRTGLRIAAILTMLAVLVAACGSATDDSADTRSDTDSTTTIASALGPLDAVGSYRFSADGVRSEPGQGASIDDIVEVSTFEVAVSTDVSTGNFRLDWSRTMGEQTVVPGVVLSYVETVTTDAGYIDGDDGVFGIGPSRPMNSSRRAAVQRQQQLLQPHLLVADSLRRGDSMEMIDDGAVELANAGGSTILRFDETTGDLRTVSTIESDPLLGDIEVVASFFDWLEVDDARFPMEAALAVDGVVVHREQRHDLETNAALEPGEFDLVDSLPPDAASYEQGWRNAQWFNRALALPFGSGFVDQTLDAPVELVPISERVVVVAGTRHNSLLVDIGDSVVIIEPSINADRSRQLLEVAADQFDAKPVSHVVLTHDHHDQIGGVREVVADGAVAVVPAGDEAFFERVFTRPRTIEPDAFSAADPALDVAIEAVGEAGWSTGDGAVTAHRFSSVHDEHMLVVCLPDEGLAFNSDLFNPGFGEPDRALPEPQRTFARELVEAIEANCPSTTGVLGSHGMPIPEVLDMARTGAGLPLGGRS